MKKFLILALLAVLIMPSLAAIYDPFDMLRGKQMIPVGGPWIGDDQKIYFGIGKDAYISYDDSQDKIYINDTPIYLEEATTFGASVSSPDLTATDDLVVGDDAYITDDLVVDGATRLDEALTVASVSANTTVAAADLTASDDAIITDDLVVDGAARIDEASTIASLTINTTLVAEDLRSTDDAFVTDDIVVDGGARIDETLTVNAVAANTTITAEDLYSSDDALIIDDLVVDGAFRADEASTIASLTVNTTLDVNGDMTTDDITMDANKNFTMSGTGTFATGTGTGSINGDTSVATNKRLAITTADKLTVGGVIVPQEMVINWPISASSVDENIFIADDAWQITKIEEVHAVAGTEAAPNLFNATVMKITGVTAPGAGVPMHNDTITLSATPNTVITPTLSAVAANTTLADGDKVGINYQGSGTSLAGGVITIHMQRV